MSIQTVGVRSGGESAGESSVSAGGGAPRRHGAFREPYVVVWRMRIDSDFQSLTPGRAWLRAVTGPGPTPAPLLGTASALVAPGQFGHRAHRLSAEFSSHSQPHRVGAEARLLR